VLPALRAEGVPIIFLNWGNRSDRANLPPEILHVYDPDGSGIGIGDELPNGSRVLEKGSWSAALVDELAIGSEGDLFIDKYRMTGFYDTELDSVLRNLDVSTVFFAGVNLDQCVLATLSDAAALGYDCVLLEDCCATTSPEGCAEATIYNVAQCFGFVADSSDLLDALSRSSPARPRREPHQQGPAFDLSRVADTPAYRIAPGDTVKLVPLRRPDSVYDASVFLEIWDPGGSQPPNTHEGSVETFFILQGSGVAHVDGVETTLEASEFVVLAPRSVHRIENTGAGRLYAITTMTPDAGFASLVEAGVPEPLDEVDLRALALREDPPPATE
jgi:nicotinamidase-related amidase/mannose-6-phosphate isomerase-like protein (cupin superfamily)